MTHEAVRERLEVQVAALAQRAGRLEGDLRKALDRDWTERATQVENDQVLEGLDEMTIAERTACSSMSGMPCVRWS